MRDMTFHSAALGRDMPYRVILSANIAPTDKLPVVYLLHGGGPGSFRNWSNYSHVARFAERRVILVMPEGGPAFYTNSAEVSGDRYEDYITSDLVSEVESRFPVIPERESRAIVGVSLGGFGALKLALHHPSMFGFAGGISSPVDDAIRRPDLDEKLHDGMFGPWGSQRRLNNDPFFLARSIDPAHAPYLFLMCGDREGGLSANRRFAALLTQRRFAHEFHVIRGGGHTWNEWDQELTNLFRSLLKQLRPSVALPPETR